MKKAVRALSASMMLLTSHDLSSQPTWRLDDYKVPVLPLEGRTLGTAGQLLLPSFISQADSLLLVVDDQADQRIAIYLKRTGQRLTQFGLKGDGPGEYRIPRAAKVDPSQPRQVWIWDLQLRRLTRANISAIPFSRGAPQAVSYPINQPLLEVTPLGGDTFVGTGTFQGASRLMFFRSDGHVLSTRGEVPTRPTDVPTNVWQNVQRVEVAASPDRKKLALASRYADRIELFTADGRPSGRSHRHFGFEPRFGKQEFSVGQGKRGAIMGLGDNSRLGYIAVAATDARIYAAFSGKLLARFKDSATMADYLHVFDWSGKPIAVYQLNENIVGLTVEPDDSRIYAIRHLPEPSIVVFELKGGR